jgi:hypothetical protein
MVASGGSREGSAVGLGDPDQVLSEHRLQVINLIIPHRCLI